MFIEVIDRLRQMKLSEEAEKAFHTVIGLAPDRAEGYLNLSAHLFEQGKFSQAESAAQEALRRGPAIAECHNALANALRGQGRLPEAEHYYREAIRITPEYAEAYKHLAMALEEMGRLDEAFVFFNRHAELTFATASRPSPATQAMFREALKCHQAGDLTRAENLYREVIAAQPDFAEAHNSLGNAFLQLGKGDAAISSYQRALAIKPNFPEALNNLGYLLLQQDRLGEAEQALRRALGAKPDYAQANSNLAAVLGKQEKLEEAAECCRKALAAEPNHAEAHSNFGHILQKQGNLKEAEVYLRKAVALNPDFAQAHQQLGVLLCESDRLTQGFDAFAQVAKLNQETAPPAAKAHQQRHDEEQQAWLGFAAPRHVIGDGARIAGPAVNPNNQIAEIDETWHTARPQIVVVDELLTAGALQKLRRFCLESTVWRKAYDGGYLGAFPEHGFAPPLLAQIAEELRATYPAIIEDYPLLHFWAFKYDSSLHGIKKHADFAAVNVNFWITPDDANLDPDHGGLVVWDVAAPLDWDFAKYNAAEDDILSFLTREKAKPITIPYRANRAVIFDSDLFHETDVIRFKPGYDNRRINVTLLFGRRQMQRGNKP